MLGGSASPTTSLARSNSPSGNGTVKGPKFTLHSTPSRANASTPGGESRHANSGISLPGTAEEPKAPVFVDGRQVTTLKGPALTEEFLKLVDDYVAARYGAKQPTT